MIDSIFIVICLIAVGVGVIYYRFIITPLFSKFIFNNDGEKESNKIHK